MSGRFAWLACAGWVFAALQWVEGTYSQSPDTWWGIMHLPMPAGALAGFGAFAGMWLSHGHYFSLGRYTPNTNDWLGLMLPKLGGWWSPGRRSSLAMCYIGWARGALMLWHLPWLWPVVLLSGPWHVLAYWLGWQTDDQQGIMYSEFYYGAGLGLLAGATYGVYQLF